MVRVVVTAAVTAVVVVVVVPVAVAAVAPAAVVCLRVRKNSRTFGKCVHSEEGSSLFMTRDKLVSIFFCV